MTAKLDWLEHNVCPICGKDFAVLYPDLWVYKVRKPWPQSNCYRYYCSWKCLRAYQKGEETMAYSKVKKDGTPAKRPGKKPEETKAAQVKAGDIVEAVNRQAEVPELPEVKKPEPDLAFAEDGVHVVKITKPIMYENFTVQAVKGDFGRYARDRFNGNDYIDYESNDGDELSMPVEAWKDFLKELVRAAQVLGVEL